MTILNLKGETADTPDTETFVTLEQWLHEGGQRVLLAASEEVEALADALGSITSVALDFPAFSDGRSYSSASILRRTYQYSGEIRAVGDVRVDQLEQMIRCGFDTFELADGQDSGIAADKLQGFSHNYQSTVDRPPLFIDRA